MRKLLTAGTRGGRAGARVGRPGTGLGLGALGPVAADRGLPVHQPAGVVHEHVLLRVAVPVVRVLQLQPRPLRELDGVGRLRLLQELRPRVPVRPGPRRLPAAAPAAEGGAEERRPKNGDEDGAEASTTTRPRSRPASRSPFPPMPSCSSTARRQPARASRAPSRPRRSSRHGLRLRADRRGDPRRPRADASPSAVVVRAGETAARDTESGRGDGHRRSSQES